MIPRFLATVLLASVCLAQNNAAQQDSQLVSKMDQAVQSYVSNKQFMGSVLVARADQILFSKAYGSANLEWDVPNTTSTKFRLASVTKQFTAACILLLEERGMLKVEDPIKKYLPTAPTAWDKVTIFHLLTHTAGIPNTPDFEGMSISSTAQNVARFRDKPLDFEPGTKWNYSNSGYILLGFLIERLSGERYEDFVKENIFDPLGMKDSGYDSNTTLIQRRASGYTSGFSGIANAAYLDMRGPGAAGALYSTTGDLLRWEQGLFGGKLLSATSLQKMTTPFKNEYAFGLQVHTVNGHKVIDHTGSIQGFNTMLVYYPDEKLTVVSLGNLSGPAPSQIAGRLGAIALGDPETPDGQKEITLDPKVLSRYVGAYQLSPSTNMVITLENNQLLSKLANQPVVPVFAQSDTVFFAKGANTQIEFAGSDAQGRAAQLTLRTNGLVISGKRLDAPGH